MTNLSLRLLASLCLAFACAAAQATTYNSNGSLSDVNTKLALCVDGDTVTIPSGAFTWGASGAAVNLSKAVTLQGAGTGFTTINIASSAGTYGSATIYLSAAGAVAKSFTVTQSGLSSTTAFATNTANGWRITDIVYNSAANVGYFCYASTYGLIDNCVLNGGAGNDELIFARGPTDSWQTADSFGTANAVYIEDCTFNNSGYVCDFNSNSRGVVRFCTITGSLKVDAHGLASNTPPRGARQMEVYDNTWTLTTGYVTAIELRGGTGRVFDNTNANTQGGWFGLVEYGCYTNQTYWGVYQTPVNYPITDQIGVGEDPKAAHSDPYYLINNKQLGVDWVLTAQAIPQGAIDLYRTQTSNPSATFTMLGDIIVADRDYYKQTVGATFNGTSGVGRGTTAQMNAITPTLAGVGFWVTDQGSWNTTITANTSGKLYTWSGSAWVANYTPYTYPHPLRGAITPNPSTIASTSAAATQITVTATATTGGVGAISYNHAINGSYAGWQASPSHAFTGLTPSTSYAFRVKAQDSAANTTTESSVSNVSTTGTVPTVSSVAIPSAGTTTVLTLSASCTTGTGGIGGVTASASGGALTLTYASGSGSGTYTFTNSRTVLASETVTLTYAQPGNGIEATTGGADLASFTGRAVTNNSTQVAATTPTVSSITIPAAGTSTTLNLNQSCTTGAGGAAGLTAVASGGALTLTYASGSGSTAYVYTNSRTVNAGETVQVTYVQPGNGIEGTTGGLDLASFSLRSVANGSTAGIPTTTPTPPAPDRQPKPKKKRS